MADDGTPTVGTGTNPRSGGGDRFRTAMNAVGAGQDKGMEVVKKAPIPTVSDEEDQSDQGGNNVTGEQVIKLVPENTMHQPGQKNPGKTTQEKKEKEEKAPVSKTVNKTIYFEPSQLKKLRDTRRKLEEIYDQDINVQDIVRYLVEQADMRIFAQFGDYLDRKNQESN